MKVDNAVILAAGVGSRMMPLTSDRPKSLIAVRGEKLIERLIRQLREKGVCDITVVVGYRREMFADLVRTFGVRLVDNPHYRTRNTCYSMLLASPFFRNTYICSADYYHLENPFDSEERHAFYCTVPPGTPGAVQGVTSDASGKILRASVPAEAGQWMTFGHAFFDASFSRTYRALLEETCRCPEKLGLYWEEVFRQNLDRLTLYEKRIDPAGLAELDTPEELAAFDPDWRSHNPWAN